MSAIVHGDVMRHFEDQQGSEGPWEKWSKSYREQMDRKGKGGNKILQDTGKLKQNFKPNHYRSSSKGLYWYNNAVTKGGFPYAYAHDEGGDQLPKRDFMWLSDDALEEVGDQTLAFLLEEGI
jgi:phage gpG-like protein